jgi:hypothetical protein
MTEIKENGKDSTITMRLTGDITAYYYGEFEMPRGAEIK